MLRNCLQLLCVCEEVGFFWPIESPSTSRIWKIPESWPRDLEQKTAAVDQCSFGLTDPVSAAFYKKMHNLLGRACRFAQVITEVSR